jgi:hypothetical protein
MDKWMKPLRHDNGVRIHAPDSTQLENALQHRFHQKAVYSLRRNNAGKDQRVLMEHIQPERRAFLDPLPVLSEDTTPAGGPRYAHPNYYHDV